MSGKHSFEAQISALEALREQPEETRLAALRKGLGAKNNFLAGKAADLIREFDLKILVPELLIAFDRLFENAEKTDPQCWAKNAISRTLAAFEHQDPEVFLRGMGHIQMEPVYGGRADTAGTLRSICALALVTCRRLTERDLLTHLLDLLADKDKNVRAEVARAIEQVGSPTASLLLRLRATVGNDEPEVLGACHAGVLRIEGKGAIPWAARFLAAADDTSAEVALAIASLRCEDAFQALKVALGNTRDPWFRSVLLSAVGLTRQESAADFLFEVVQKESLDAEAAIESIVRSMPSKENIERLKKLVAGNLRLEAVLSRQQK